MDDEEGVQFHGDLGHFGWGIVVGVELVERDGDGLENGLGWIEKMLPYLRGFEIGFVMKEYKKKREIK